MSHPDPKTDYDELNDLIDNAKFDNATLKGSNMENATLGAKTDYNPSPSDLIEQEVHNLASDVNRLFDAIRANPMAYIGEEDAIFKAQKQLTDVWMVLRLNLITEKQHDRS